ncbi:MAG: sugar ABC transporter permease [Clostridiales bacterium]|nr:sugar ABC transporter permease [Clostridiales bacterium]MDY3745798.1 sugar ABC transporter permease [Lachnospiraceae bacterium]
MSIKFKKRVNEFPTPYTVSNAVKKGGLLTKLSMLIMGAGNIAHKQIIKGLIFLLMEVAFVYFMITTGAHCLAMLPSLGDRAQEEVWNEAKGIYEYVAGDNSLLILLYGVVTIFVIIWFIFMWRAAVKSAYKTECLAKEGKHINSIKDDIKDMFHMNLHKTLLTLPLAGILAFNILPLAFMICMAFTNYSKQGDHLMLFDWVGLDNFAKVLSFSDSIGQTFWPVLGWTLVWAVFATGLNYIFGMILAILINRNGTRFKSFWRFCFILSIAVPQFVSLLIMRTMLQPSGAVNVLLQNLGLIDSPLPFWTNATWARVTVIIINLWVGIPYTMMQVTGILQNIPAELYEAAKVDGANAVVTFFKITLPYMLFVTMPYLITTFTGNVNNFNVIYLLSGGDPTPVGSTAGKTDLLVTWLYKLTIDQQYYNIGAVIGIFTFVVLAIVSLITYRNTGSYKNEEGFQ